MNELRKIADEATPGPWKRDGREGLTRIVYTDFDADPDDPGADIAEVLYHDSDAAFIATFDPQLVGALLDVAEAAHNAYVECSCLWTGGTHEKPRRTFVCASCRLEEKLDALDALTEEA